MELVKTLFIRLTWFLWTISFLTFILYPFLIPEKVTVELISFALTTLILYSIYLDYYKLDSYQIKQIEKLAIILATLSGGFLLFAGVYLGLAYKTSLSGPAIAYWVFFKFGILFAFFSIISWFFSFFKYSRMKRLRE